MTKHLTAFQLYPTINVVQDETRDEDSCQVRCIEGSVRGLAVVEEG